MSYVHVPSVALKFTDRPATKAYVVCGRWAALASGSDMLEADIKDSHRQVTSCTISLLK
jgi:hypothetical protein